MDGHIKPQHKDASGKIYSVGILQDMTKFLQQINGKEKIGERLL